MKPAFPTKEDLISSWISLCKFSGDAEVKVRTQWTVEFFRDLAVNNPEIAFDVVLDVIERDSSIEVLRLTAAGPMEDILCVCGEKLLNRILVESSNKTEFRHLLGGVWQRTMSDALYGNIARLADYSKWNSEISL